MDSHDEQQLWSHMAYLKSRIQGLERALYIVAVIVAGLVAMVVWLATR